MFLAVSYPPGGGSATYDKRGLITQVHSGAGWSYYAYDARGAVVRKTLPNGSYVYYAYDDAGRLTALENRKGDGTAIATFGPGCQISNPSIIPS